MSDGKEKDISWDSICCLPPLAEVVYMDNNLSAVAYLISREKFISIKRTCMEDTCTITCTTNNLIDNKKEEQKTLKQCK